MVSLNETDDLIKRAKLRALHLLEYMDRTEQQLREKLRADYSEDVVDIALEYVKSFGYINDEGYAKRYIENRKDSKSKEELRLTLVQKGISKTTISDALEECYEEQDELNAIRKLLDKKHFCGETASEKEKQKIYGYLMRKGFHYDTVRQVLQVSSSNT